MFDIAKICDECSQKIGQELNYDKNKIAVVNYGLFAFIQMLISILLVAIFGMIFGVLIESLIISFTISILRKYSGGAHASSPGKCAVMGVILSVGMGLVINNINIKFEYVVLLGLIVFILSYYLVYKLAPVDSIAKPIKNRQKIKSLKRGSILILTFYFIIVIFNLLWYLKSGEIRVLIYSLCMYIGLLWQVFSLTQSGHKILSKIDALF